jgi:hypothetical protein
MFEQGEIIVSQCGDMEEGYMSVVFYKRLGNYEGFIPEINLIVPFAPF